MFCGPLACQQFTVPPESAHVRMFMYPFLCSRALLECSVDFLECFVTGDDRGGQLEQKEARETLQFLKALPSEVCAELLEAVLD